MKYRGVWRKNAKDKKIVCVVCIPAIYPTQIYADGNIMIGQCHATLLSISA